MTCDVTVAIVTVEYKTVTIHNALKLRSYFFLQFNVEFIQGQFV